MARFIRGSSPFKIVKNHSNPPIETTTKEVVSLSVVSEPNFKTRKLEQIRRAENKTRKERKKNRIN
jgi:hypothetical protein